MQTLNIINLIIILFIGIFIILIFLFHYKKSSYNYNEIIKQISQDNEDNLSKLKLGNKKINDLEIEILECKKKLGFKKFKNN